MKNRALALDKSSKVATIVAVPDRRNLERICVGTRLSSDSRPLLQLKEFVG